MYKRKNKILLNLRVGVEKELATMDNYWIYTWGATGLLHSNPYNYMT